MTRLDFMQDNFASDPVDQQDDQDDQLSDEDDDDVDANAITDASASPNGLSWLMSRLSFVARRLIIKKPSAAELIAQPVSGHKFRV